MGRSKPGSDLVLFRGGGELASGAIRRLFIAGFRVVVLERENPICVRRTVSFANAVYEGSWEVEGIKAKRVTSIEEVEELLRKDIIPVLIDEEGGSIQRLKPGILVDARMAKRNLGTSVEQADVVIALGPGFRVPEDAHYIIETCRGHDLGRVIRYGSAKKDTGIPGEIMGKSAERVLRAPIAGRFFPLKDIGDIVFRGEEVAKIGSVQVYTGIDGVIRGLLKGGLEVRKGQKVGDVDPRGDREYIHRISDKANAVAGGVMEAVFTGLKMLNSKVN
ncbi:MAG: selenium-dependent molybdenum cofactor biosynthesis protein YqeB [Fidelibacterota bacterium]